MLEQGRANATAATFLHILLSPPAASGQWQSVSLWVVVIKNNKQTTVVASRKSLSL